MERSFADLEYETKKRKTRRERFLGKMDALIPWCKLLEEIKPYYPCAEKGRVPYPLESMLRVHCVQLFYNLSDPAMEDMLYEVESVPRFCISAWGKCRMRARFSTSATDWSVMDWGGSCLRESVRIWQSKVCC